MSGDNQELDGTQRLLLDALNAQMQRLLRENNEELHERMEHLEGLINQRDARRGGIGGGGPRPNRLEGVKLNIPPFKGKSDPEAYLEWELKIEHLFSCNNYDEPQKVKLAAAEFSDYALVWWHKLQKERARNEEPVVESWAEMKRIMRKRYVPSNYTRDLKIKLQKLSQGSKSVEDYHKEMEVLMMQAKIEEDDEVTMVRFLHGLETNIRDIVELQEYVEMNDLLHKAMQAEQQLKRKSVAKRSSSNFGASWRDKGEVAVTPSKAAPTPSKPSSSSSQEPSKKSRDVKCFRCQGLGHYAYECPNKKAMVLRGGEVVSEDELENDDEDEASEEYYEPGGELLMIRRLLNNQSKPMEECQRENIFHSRCLINGKLCLMIIDGGSCVNVASERLVSKLNLVTKPHPRPYTLQWLSEEGELQVKEQVELDFSIGKYDDKVLCDVIPMEASHLLLGRPWQFDKRANQDGFTNKISFMHQDKKIVLKPLSPQEICEDQKKMREKIIQERKEKERQTLECSKSEDKKSENFETPKEKQHGATTKQEVKNILFTNKSFYLKNCDDIFPNTNLLVSPNLFLCEDFLQGFKDTKDQTYGSLDHQSYELSLVT